MQHLGDLNYKILLISSIVLFLYCGNGYTQNLTVEEVPRTLDFGEFWTLNGGDIKIDEYGGAPTIDANIIHINRQPSGPVTFNIKSAKGKEIYYSYTITNDTDCILTLEFDKNSGVKNPNPASTWFPIQMGGTLSVPSNPTPGKIDIYVVVTFSTDIINE